MNQEIIPSNAISDERQGTCFRGNAAEYRSQWVRYSALIRDANAGTECEAINSERAEQPPEVFDPARPFEWRNL